MQHGQFSFHFLLHAGDLVEEHLRRRLADLDVRPRQARVLDALGRMGAASQIDLARSFHITPASMSTMTARLIAADLISRKTDPEEARSNVLQLTARGQSLLSAIHLAWQDVDRMIEERLGADKAAALATLTRELRNGLGGRMPGAVLPGLTISS
ncbi:MarR family winged helix-turn-helix transcriptional regulator [Roseovarius sp. Pro17]|uniref:MarR family winged helix-turn-helix transcriptional regulator n=1 Tax=Roseovarius sp. Pro17 TaxID=3108175 RepID=UPI002D78F055|nr:MarR family winged helix-turn-helix transcriptional regulator [Roseovarius sp. Pro17]